MEAAVAACELKSPQLLPGEIARKGGVGVTGDSAPLEDLNS